MAATGGHVGSVGSGRRPLAHSARTLPGVSWPSSVVRSTIETARSRANCLAVVLIDRVARPAALASTPTWSTPGRPCRNRRSVAGEAAASARSSTVPVSGGGAVVVTPSGYCRRFARRPPRLELLGPQGGVAGLDQPRDDAQALVERPERRLHGVDGQPLDLVPAEPERGHQVVHLAAHRDVGHQAVVGV